MTNFMSCTVCVRVCVRACVRVCPTANFFYYRLCRAELRPPLEVLLTGHTAYCVPPTGLSRPAAPSCLRLGAPQPTALPTTCYVAASPSCAVVLMLSCQRSLHNTRGEFQFGMVVCPHEI